MTTGVDRPLASVSLDLDNQWAYMKTHGDRGWESFPSYFDVLVPHLLSLLERLGLKITVFVVGQDAALQKNAGALSLLAASGHDLGNHSFHHEQWIHQRSRADLAREVFEAQETIERVTSRRTRGYRGPGFSWSRELLSVLQEHDYLYDASTLPTYLGPLARLYYLRSTKLTAAQKEQRKNLFGGFREGRRPLRPYFWRLPSGARLLEMPVTTMPLARLPFHLSYLLYLSRVSKVLMSLYLRTALALCKLTRTEPSFLLHPLDLLGGEQVPDLAFFPGMDLSASFKGDVFSRVLTRLGREFRLVDMNEHARAILGRERTPVRELDCLPHGG